MSDLVQLVNKDWTETSGVKLTSLTTVFLLQSFCLVTDIFFTITGLFTVS